MKRLTLFLLYIVLNNNCICISQEFSQLEEIVLFSLPSLTYPWPGQRESLQRLPFFETWRIYDRYNRELECAWYTGEMLKEEEQIFVEAFSKTYEHLSPQELGTNDLIAGLRATMRNEYKLAHEQREGYYLVTVRYQNRAIGFASFNRMENPRHIYVRLLAITPSWWHRGLGKQLLFAVLRMAPDAQKLCLSVRKANKNACQFYQALGFKESSIVHGPWELPSFYGS